MRRRALLASAAAGILMTTALTACQSDVACPAIAAAPFVTLHVTAGMASTLAPGSVSATVCQDAGCHSGPLALTAEQGGGTPGTGTQGTGLVGHIDLGVLTETPIDLTIAAQDRLGQTLGPYRIQFAPHVSYPFGYTCPRVITAEATWSAAGLSWAP